jgi:hypothetical protein
MLQRGNTIFYNVVACNDEYRLVNQPVCFKADFHIIPAGNRSLSPDQIALIRLVNMESTRYPALAARYYEYGPKPAERALALYLSHQISKGLLREEDPITMARQLMNLITGSPVRWFVLGFDSQTMTKKIVQRHIHDAVQMFLRAYAVSQD